MKFGVSLTIVVLLMALPLGCVLAACQPMQNPCCPRTAPNLKCPYDALDSAKIAVVTADVPEEVVTIAPLPEIAFDFSPVAVEYRGDLTILNRVLRI